MLMWLHQQIRRQARNKQLTRCTKQERLRRRPFSKRSNDCRREQAICERTPHLKTTATYDPLHVSVALARHQHNRNSPVERLGRSDVHQHQAVNLPILQSLPNNPPGQLSFRRQTLFPLQTVVDHFFLERGEESCLVGPVVHHPEGGDSDQKGQDAFPNELPSAWRLHRGENSI